MLTGEEVGDDEIVRGNEGLRKVQVHLARQVRVAIVHTGAQQRYLDLGISEETLVVDLLQLPEPGRRRE